MGTLPQSGSLAKIPLPRLLIALYRERFEGGLCLARQRARKRVVFKAGSPVLAESNATGESLSVQLAEEGAIDREQQARIDRLVAERDCPEGAAVLALELLEPRELFGALQRQLRRRIWSCFEWTDGEFSTDLEVDLPEDAEALRCEPLRLTLDGLVRHWGTNRLAMDLSPRLGQYPVRTRSFDAIARRLPDDDTVRGAVASLDGTRNLGQALGAAATDPSLLAAVWILGETGAVEYRDEPMQDDASPGEVDIEIEVTGGSTDATASPGAPRARAGASDTAASPDDGLSPEATELRDRILELHGQLEDITHYAILGIEEDAAAGAVKKAYFKAAKRFHPDALARLGLEDDLKEKANEVFARIAKAHTVLTDAEQRASYEAQLSGHEEVDAERLAQAETFYRKGEILLKMGNFADALEMLKGAVQLWPEDYAYQSTYGWALYKANGDLGEAREAIEKAISLQADDAVSHQRLAIVLRDLGEAEASKAAAATAKRLDPNVRA